MGVQQDEDRPHIYEHLCATIRTRIRMHESGAMKDQMVGVGYVSCILGCSRVMMIRRWAQMVGYVQWKYN
jgi:hypothetical protein